MERNRYKEVVLHTVLAIAMLGCGIVVIRSIAGCDGVGIIKGILAFTSGLGFSNSLMNIARVMDQKE